MSNYLVVANQTLLSAELTDTLLRVLGEDSNARFILVVPATPSEDLIAPEPGEAHQIAARRAGHALLLLTDIGIPVTAAHVGASSLSVAIDEAVGARTEGIARIILCTFPTGVSRWQEPNLVEGLQRAFHIPVTHIVASVAHR